MLAVHLPLQKPPLLSGLKPTDATTGQQLIFRCLH